MELRESSSSSSPPPTSGLSGAFGNRNGPRSRAGCWTCRQKKVKCDEVRPRCQRCIRLSRECDYTPRARKRPERRTLSFASTGTRPYDQSSGQGTIESLDSPGDTFQWMLDTAGASTDLSSTTLGPDIDEVLRSSPWTLFEQDASRSFVDETFSPRSVSRALAVTIPSTSGLLLSERDHETIRHYRTVFAINQHTKNPQYSVLSIIFNYAESNPMVMHMVLAVSGRQIAYQSKDDINDDDESEASITAGQHYCESMRLMSRAFEQQNEPNMLENILAALWLMMVYEQRFGDDDGAALSSHLQGAATLLRTGGGRFLQIPRLLQSPKTLDAVVQQKANSRGNTSYFASRMFVWIALLDSWANTYGLGGFNHTLVSHLHDQFPETRSQSPMQLLTAIHRYSNPLFKSVWGEAYPQSEMLDDLENRAVFDFYGECSGLRYMLSGLPSPLQHTSPNAEMKAETLERGIVEVGERYAEILKIAASLQFQEAAHRRFVSNVRWIVPHYHATVLGFYRATRFRGPLGSEQRAALREIVNIAFRAYKDEGDQAMFRIAWPLFMATLETDDLIHRQWMLDRFKALGKYGKNYKRAYGLLETVVKDQDEGGCRVDVGQYLDSGRFERFCI